MAKNDIRIHSGSYTKEVWQTEAGATAILIGEPVKLKVAGSPYVIPLADNEPVIGTTTEVVGFAASDSNHTASANGTVEVYRVTPNTILECAASTSTNFDSDSEIKALQGDRVLFDLISSTYTVDENAGDTATSGIEIVGGDATRAVVYFRFRQPALTGPVS